MKFTIDQLIAKVREIANREPDYKYEGFQGMEISKIPGNGSYCQYLTSKNNPGRGCIFGVALLELGLTRKEVQEYEGDRIHRRLIERGYSETLKLDWCGWVQGHQDKGNSWSEAVRYADKLANIL